MAIFNTLIIFIMRTILFSILVLMLASCGMSEKDTKTANEYAAIRAANMQQSETAKPIKVAKKRNCANKQTFEGARGGIFHWDTAKNGNVYKHYVKQ